MISAVVGVRLRILRTAAGSFFHIYSYCLRLSKFVIGLCYFFRVPTPPGKSWIFFLENCRT